MHLPNLILTTLMSAQMLEAKILFLIRHGEKPVEDKRATFLSPKGKVRAECISHIFNGEHERGGMFESPKRIIAQPVGGGHLSTRPVDTVAPLAQRLGLTIEQDCGPKDYDCIEDSVLRDDIGPILISWEHKRLRKILKRFVSRTPEGKLPRIPKYRYDVVWKVDTEKRSLTVYSEECDSFFAAASLKYSPTTEQSSEKQLANDLTPLPFAHLSLSRIIHVYQLPLSSLDNGD